MKYKIAVSGAAKAGHCGAGVLKKAKEVGREIIRQNGILMTGATSGIPYWSAIGAKKEGGTVIGLSPAASLIAHKKSYRLPTDYHDIIVYTGFEYAGRNLILTRSADAVIIICGRIGTLNEFTIAFEDKKPIGVLVESGGTADMIKSIVQKSHRGLGKIVYDSNPQKLISRVIKLIEKEK
jgi:hypothetical protein